MKILAFFVVLLIICIVCLIFYLHASFRDVKMGQIVTGSVIGWEKSKLPGFGRVLIEYTIKGRRHMCGSSLIPNYKKPMFRPRSMRRYMLRTYRNANTGNREFIATPVL